MWPSARAVSSRGPSPAPPPPPRAPDPPDLPTTDDPSFSTAAAGPFSTAAAEPAGSQSFRPPVEPPALVNGYPSVVGAIDYVTGRVMKIDMRQWPGESGVEMLERWIREAQQMRGTLQNSRVSCREHAPEVNHEIRECSCHHTFSFRCARHYNVSPV